MEWIIFGLGFFGGSGFGIFITTLCVLSKESETAAEVECRDEEQKMRDLKTGD